jgi:hypothetical protein
LSREITSREFKRALAQITPTDKQRKFLQAHYRAVGRVATTTNLKDAAGYKSHGAVNLHYGGLAKRIAKILKRSAPPVRLDLLVKFVPRKKLSNEHWILHMRPAFARALRSANWVK